MVTTLHPLHKTLNYRLCQIFCSVLLHLSRKSLFFQWQEIVKLCDSSGEGISSFSTYHFLLPTPYCLHNILFPCIPHFFGIPVHISRPLALASPYPSDFVTFISIRYQELYWLLIYTKTIQNDEKHAEKIKPLRSQTQSLERAASLLFVLQKTNEQHTLL